VSDFVFIHIPKTGGTSIRTALDLWSTTHHTTAREMRRMHPESSGQFYFTVVRNPWDRIVSYAHSLRGRKRKNVWDYPNVPLNLTPQVDYVLDEDGTLLVDFIGRYETLAEDFETICGKIGIPTPPLPHLNRATERRQYREYFDERAMQFIADSYAEDIARFGYSF